MFARVILVTLGTIAATACIEDYRRVDGAASAPDLGTLPDTLDTWPGFPDTGDAGAGEDADTGPDLPGCDFEGFTSTQTAFIPEPDGVLGTVVADDANGHRIYIDFWPGAALAVGSYQLSTSEDELDYDFCTVCVLGERVDSPHNTGFFAISGTLVIESFDPSSLQFRGSLSGASMVEIIVHEDPANERIEGGRRWCIDSLDLYAPPSSLR
jgi:hypothetical protein